MTLPVKSSTSLAAETIRFDVMGEEHSMDTGAAICNW